MEEDKNYTRIIITGIFIAILIIICGFTNYKNETLTCNKTENICKIHKTNLFNIKFDKNIIKYSEIEDVSYYTQRIKGNRYGKGYKEYFIAFNTKNNEQIKIFSKSYYDKSELNNAIKELKSEIFDTSGDTIEYKREN